jgi:hypothetical protein
MGLNARSIEVTLQPIGSAGAALIDHDDVPSATNLSENVPIEPGIFRRRLARSARQDEQRIRIFVYLQRWKHRDIKRDPAAAFCLPILIDFKASLLQLAFNPIDTFRFQIECRRDDGRRDQREQECS